MAFMPAGWRKGDFGLEIDVLIGDVEGEDSAGSEVALVERDGLRGEQMQRNGVAGECVDDEDVELLRGFGGE